MIEFKRLDTGVTASVPSTTLDSFEIRGSTDGNTFTFYINDVLVATITTNLPPATSYITPKAYGSVGGVSSVVGITMGNIVFVTEPQ